jgi:hypothetical protein
VQQEEGDLALQLRAWAKGSYSLEAAVELLIRSFGGRFAQPGWPWVRTDDGYPWIDFQEIPRAFGPLSSGERQLLLIAASLADGVMVDLGDAVGDLDRRHLGLVLAALSHAGGTHEQTEVLPERMEDGREIITPWGARLDLGPLHPWPDAPP